LARNGRKAIIDTRAFFADIGLARLASGEIKTIGTIFE